MSLYSSKSVPDDYVCSTCGVTGVKLWRKYQILVESQTLACATCSLVEAEKRDGVGTTYSGPVSHDGLVDVRVVKSDGKVLNMGKSDSIGWRVPAVPTEENDTYWGYSSVPQAGVDWWKSLPTYSQLSMFKLNDGRSIETPDGFLSAVKFFLVNGYRYFRGPPENLGVIRSLSYSVFLTFVMVVVWFSESRERFIQLGQSTRLDEIRDPNKK